MIKVAIYEDNKGLRELLATIIQQSNEFTLVGEYPNCLEAAKDTQSNTPDVILMDIDMPGRSGIEAVQEIKSLYPEIEIIMNTVFDDDDRIFSALQAGATGYLLKRNSLATLLDSIREVKAGGAPMSPTIARRVLSLPFIQKTATESEDSAILSPREKEILLLLSKGYSYKMIANELFLSLDTIRSHIKKIYQKLHVHSVTEAVNKVFLKK